MRFTRKTWRFIFDGLTAVIIVAGLMFIYWGLSTLPMHHYGGR
jgi:hypothetical protein